MTNSEVIDNIKKSFELKNQGFYKPAIEMLYKALAIDGDNLEILAQLAHLYTLLENYDRAICYVEKVLDLNPKHLDCLILLSEIYVKQENLNLAKEICEKIYQIQPISTNLAIKINILNKLHDFESVREIEKTTTDLSEDVLYEFAFAYYENLDLKKAQELLELGYAKNNKNEKIMLLLAKIFYENKDFQKSKNLYLELEKINPTAEVMNYLGLFKLGENSYTQAIDYFSKAHHADEQNAEYLYNLASGYFLNGWMDEALKYFNQAICFDPENIDYHFSLAYLYYQKKMYEKASYEINFIKTIEQHHELSNVLSAMITAKNGDLLNAKSQLEAIVKENKSDDFAYSALSGIYKELSQIELAETSIKQAIELKPNSLEYLSELIGIQLEQQKYDEALKLAEKIIDINEKYLYAHIVVAKIYVELKDFDRVYDSAQDIIELDSNCPEGYYYNAIALFEQGDKDFAIESMKKAISLDLNNALLYVKISELYQDLGDFKQAYAWAQEASAIDERNYQYKWLCARLAAILKNEEDALKFYSQSYRLGSFDNELKQDYAKYLTVHGKEKQAALILG